MTVRAKRWSLECDGIGWLVIADDGALMGRFVERTQP